MMFATGERKRYWLAVAPCLALLWMLPVTTGLANELVTDQAITDKIDDELLIDHGVVSTKLDVKVTDGIAALTGSVNNILAKERAAKIAATVKGVRSVINRVEVRPSVFRDDAAIERDIDRALREDPGTESYEIAAEVNEGVATLTGVVQSYHERELAKKVVKGVRGVVDLRDQIDVNYKADRIDGEIKRGIEQAMKWNAYIDDYLINVNVTDGRVSLSGTVGSAAEKSKAKWVSWVAGVKSVDAEKLSVERWARDPDLRGDKYVSKPADEIRNAIDDALLLDPRVLLFNVDVDVTGNLVTLRGQVGNLKAKRAAESVARNTVGVSYVTNRLKVRSDDEFSDSDIVDNIKAKFTRDPYVERFDISTVVINGTAHLYGTVDSYYEKNRADDLAAMVKGVVDVKNHVSVDDNESYLYDPYVDDSYFSDEIVDGYEPRVATKTDAQIKESIESEMWWSPFVDSTDVTVDVDNGVARLTGTVQSWSEFRAVTENAYEGGATLVDNDVTVDSSS